jgi:hypothetical protein
VWYPIGADPPGPALHPQLIGSTDFGPISLSGTIGLLGSDQLRRFGWVIFDYTGGQRCSGEGRRSIWS